MRARAFVVGVCIIVASTTAFADPITPTKIDISDVLRIDESGEKGEGGFALVAEFYEWILAHIK